MKWLPEKGAEGRGDERTVLIPVIQFLLVEKILSNPDSPAVPHLEKEIDVLVYDLYGLTTDEIAIVEGKRKDSQQINYPA